MPLAPGVSRMVAVVAVTMFLAVACGSDAQQGAAQSPETATVAPIVEPAATPTTGPIVEPAATPTTGPIVEPGVTATTAPLESATLTPDVELAGPLGCETNITDDVPLFYATYFRCTDIAVDGDVVVISGSGLPPHASYYYGETHGLFEEFDYSRGDEYRPSPNQISASNYTIRIPLTPVEAEIVIDETTVNLGVGDATDYPLGLAGVALNGVAMFSPLAAPGDDIENEKFTFDSFEGHPQQRGVYHYHAASPGPLAVLQLLGHAISTVVGETGTELYGVMCDGSLVMGEGELDGSLVATELDVQAGHVHDIVDSEGVVQLANRYHVHMAADIGAEPRGLTPEARFYATCDVR